MKRLIYIASLLSILFLASCKNDMIEIFDESPDVRAQKFNQQNKNTLISKENGWKGYYSSIDQIGAWRVVMKFDADGNVRLKSEKIKISADYQIKKFNTTTGKYTGKVVNVPVINIPAKDESVSYDIVTSQTSKLVFKSHCILNDWHSATNITQIKVKDTIREHILGGEFQFIVKSSSDSRVELESLTDKSGYKTNLVLVPASAEDWNGINEAKVAEIKRVLKEGATSDKYFRNFSSVTGTETPLGGQIAVDNENRVLRYSYLKDEQIKTSMHRFAITETGFTLVDSIPLVNGKKLANFIYNKVNDTFECSEQGMKTKIEYSNTPGIKFFPFIDEWGKKDGENVSSALQYSTMNYNTGGTISKPFYNMCSKLSRVNALKSFDFYINDTKNPSGCPTTLTLNYNIPVEKMAYVFNIDIPVEVERVSNKCMIFKLKDDYKKAFSNSYNYIEKKAPGIIKKFTKNIFDKISNMDVNIFTPEQKAKYTADKLSKLNLDDRSTLTYLLGSENLIEVLTDKSGFYMLPDIAYTPESKQPYKVVLMISVSNPEIRFITEAFDFSSIKKK